MKMIIDILIIISLIIFSIFFILFNRSEKKIIMWLSILGMVLSSSLIVIFVYDLLH